MTKSDKSIYKGFAIRREAAGKYGNYYRYRCGTFVAPRKKDVMSEIDRLLLEKEHLIIQIARLERDLKRPRIKCIS